MSPLSLAVSLAPRGQSAADASAVTASGLAAGGAPSDSGWFRHGRWLALVLVVLPFLAPVLGSDPTSRSASLLLGSLAGLTLLAGLTKHYSTGRLGVALTATVAAFRLPWQFAWWPLPGVAGVATYLALGVVGGLGGRRAAHVEPAASWWPGRVGRGEVAAITAIAVVSGGALVAYHALTAPALTFGAGLVRGLPSWAPPVAGLVFVAGNAGVEELLFRGMILTHLAHAVGRWPALLVQAAGFGLLHLHGYPHGPVGAALAAGYGLALGLLRLRTGGLLACWITHMLADSVIFIFIVEAATRSH